MVRFTSAITLVGPSLLHRGHFAPAPCDQQFVRFSEALMVKKPPSSGAAMQICATTSRIQRWTSGTLVQSVEYSPSLTPFNCGCAAKKDAGNARGSFR